MSDSPQLHSSYVWSVVTQETAPGEKRSHFESYLKADGKTLATDQISEDQTSAYANYVRKMPGGGIHDPTAGDITDDTVRYVLEASVEPRGSITEERWNRIEVNGSVRVSGKHEGSWSLQTLPTAVTSHFNEEFAKDKKWYEYGALSMSLSKVTTEGKLEPAEDVTIYCMPLKRAYPSQ